MNPRTLTAIRQNSFSRRIVSSWNELPDNVLADLKNQFKESAMSTRPRTGALRMPSTHPAIRNANHR